MRNYDVLDAVTELVEVGIAFISPKDKTMFEYELQRLGIEPNFQNGVELSNGNFYYSMDYFKF